MSAPSDTSIDNAGVGDNSKVETNNDNNNATVVANAWSNSEKPSGALASASTGKEPAKSVAGKVLASMDLPPRTTSAPPQMPSQQEKSNTIGSAKAKGTTTGTANSNGKPHGKSKQKKRKNSKNNNNYHGKGNFNANVQQFVPGPNMYNQQMYYQPQYPAQHGGSGGYQVHGNRGGHGGRRGGRGYHNNRKHQQQQQQGHYNAQQMAAYQHWQQQQHMLYMQQQQHMMYMQQQQQQQQPGPPHAGFNPNIGTFVAQQFVPPPYQSNTPSWTPPNNINNDSSSSNSRKNSNNNQQMKNTNNSDISSDGGNKKNKKLNDAVSKTALQPQRARKPLAITDKDGNIINGNIIKEVAEKAKEAAENNTGETDGAVLESVTNDMANIKVTAEQTEKSNGNQAGLKETVDAEKNKVIGRNGKYTLEELRSLRSCI